MDVLFTALAILFWMCLGALIAVAVMAILQSGKGPCVTEAAFVSSMNETLERYQQLVDERIRERYAPYSDWLDKPCWVKSGHGNQAGWKKHLVVAVSRKGSVNVRPWGASDGARWISGKKVAERVRFEEVEG